MTTTPIASERATLVAETVEMMRFRTVNPPGDELPLATWLAGRAREFGMDTQIEQIAPSRGNCVARFEFGPGPTVVLCSHLDVVPALEQAMLEPVVRAGRIHGRGACDAKGPLAAMLAAARRLVSTDGLSGTLVLAAVADEETDATGARHLIEDLTADAVIIGEPTDNHPVLASRGALRLAVDFEGVACHSGTPHQGRNAVHAAARFIVAGEAYDRQLRESGRWASHAATVVNGGTKLNMVPDHCRVLVDRRLAPEETLDTALAEITAVLEGLRREDPELTWSLTEAGIWLEPFDISPASPFGQRILEAIGVAEPGSAFPGGTDAPHFISRSVPAVILGPGQLEKAHSDDEWIDIAQLHAAVDLYQRCAMAFLTPDAS